MRDDWRANPRVGDVIRQRNPRHRLGRVPRHIIRVEVDRVETSGMAGGQRDGWMSRASLSSYELVERGPEFPETFEDTIGCAMCGAHIDDPCDCFDPESERRYRPKEGLDA